MYYQYSLSPWLYQRRVNPPELDPSVPVNQCKRDEDARRVKTDVDYAMQVAKGYRNAMHSIGATLKGKTLLEVGPGINYGCAIVLAAHGAKPWVLDRFLAPWEQPYHQLFYSLLCQKLQLTEPEADVRPLVALLAAKGYPNDVIECVAAPLESAPLPSDHFDFVISNAVVEHLSDLDEAFAQLYRVTRPGGIGLHQVDFRDHRDFDRPLEYLLFKEEEFSAMFRHCHYECGNRHRREEVTERFQDAGFEIVRVDGSCFTKEAYLAQFLPRLRRCNSRYRDWPEGNLRTLSGFFVIRKPNT
jgi:SAM-dependent methyltransferase